MNPVCSGGPFFISLSAKVSFTRKISKTPAVYKMYIYSQFRWLSSMHTRQCFVFLRLVLINHVSFDVFMEKTEVVHINMIVLY